jgi:hypothetical protein
MMISHAIRASVHWLHALPLNLDAKGKYFTHQGATSLGVVT